MTKTLHLQPTVMLNILRHNTKINTDSGQASLTEHNLKVGDTVFKVIDTNTTKKKEVDKKILNSFTNIVDRDYK